MTGQKGDCLYKYQLYDVKRRVWWYQRPASHPSILYHSHLISMTSITVTKNTSAYNANKRPKKPQNISLNVNQLFLLGDTEKCVCVFFRLVFCQKLFLCRCCRQFICVVTACELGIWVLYIQVHANRFVERTTVFRSDEDTPTNQIINCCVSRSCWSNMQIFFFHFLKNNFTRLTIDPMKMPKHFFFRHRRQSISWVWQLYGHINNHNDL